MAKATHYGICQLCGNRQKLPGGNLSKHGYTVQWGFFEGTCPGSHHLPFEQDCSLLENAAARARRNADDIEAGAHEYAANPSLENIWYQKYVPAHYVGRKGVPGRMVWVKGELTVTKIPYSVGGGFYYNAEWANEEKPRDRKFDTCGVDKEAPNSVAAYARSKWAKAQLKRAAQLREYAEWIEGRLANWAPQELTPVED